MGARSSGLDTWQSASRADVAGTSGVFQREIAQCVDRGFSNNQLAIIRAIGAINEDLAIWKVIIVCPASMLIPWRRGNRALARSASEHRRARWEDTDRGAISKRAAARLLAALHHEKVEKKGAKYHQFFGIRFAVAEALRATRPDGGRRSA